MPHHLTLSPRARRVLPSLAAALLLAGCSHHGHRPDHGAGQPRPHQAVAELKVDGGKVQVSPELLYFSARRGPATITWTLPADSPFNFVKEGAIVIKAVEVGLTNAPRPEDVFKCSLGDKGKSYRCENRVTRPGVYKYTIRLQGANGQVIERDPPIINDF